MPSCAFVPCAEAGVCALAGGKCVVKAFPKPAPEPEAAAGLKKGARKGAGPPKGKQPKRR